MCTVLLPPDVNPIAVNKHIYLLGNQRGISNLAHQDNKKINGNISNHTTKVTVVTNTQILTLVITAVKKLCGSSCILSCYIFLISTKPAFYPHIL